MTMVAWQPQPQAQVIVTHSGTEYTLDARSIIVRRHENGFDTGTVILEDTQARNYGGKVSADDSIEIKQKDESDASWTTVLKGKIRRAEPILSNRGSFLKLECDGSGYGLFAMACGQEYGSESDNSSLDTIKEMIEDATDGIIPKWVNKVLGSATSSGYSYTTQVETIAGSMRYIYSPFKPASRLINDICDVLQGVKGASAGPHWIVDTSERLLLATVGNHGSPASTYWPTWWRSNEAGSTLTEGKDFANFKFEELAKEANYILYHGKVIKPLDLDAWTENNASDWSTDTYTNVTDDASGKVGAAIKITSQNTGGALKAIQTNYPDTLDMGLNVESMGGKYDVPIFHCWAKIDSDLYASNSSIEFGFYGGAGGTGFWNGDCQEVFGAADRWTEIIFPIGPYWDHAPRYIPPWLSLLIDNVDWADLDYIKFRFYANANGWDMWIDNMYISGSVLRGARPSAAYSSSDPCKTKLITDEVAKDDTMVASDDAGTIARLAYAELLRCKSTPLVGSFTIPVANDLLPGQKIHLEAKKKSDGSFRIGKDFRVTRLVHSFSEQGFFTTVDVTDDLTNANPRPIPSQLNAALKAVRPEFQDRQASSIKARAIDITQDVLEKQY